MSDKQDQFNDQDSDKEPLTMEENKQFTSDLNFVPSFEIQQPQGPTGNIKHPNTQGQTSNIPPPQFQHIDYLDPNIQYQQNLNLQQPYPTNQQNLNLQQPYPANQQNPNLQQPHPVNQQDNLGAHYVPAQNQMTEEERRLQAMFVSPVINNQQSEGALGIQKFCGNALNCVCLPVFALLGINRFKVGPSEVGIRLKGGAFDAYMRPGIYYENTCLYEVKIVDCRTEMMPIDSASILTSDNVQLH